MTSTDIETVREAFPEYDGESFADLAATALTVYGPELEKGALLAGVPFCMTNVTFRTGDFKNSVIGENGPYCSIELVTGDEKLFGKAVKRGRMPEPWPVDPEEQLVINEAGTGVYRQVVRIWESLGWIRLPDGPDGGKYGESRFDTPLGAWEIIDGSPVSATFPQDGTPVYDAATRVFCPRGLRVSEYENEWTKEGVTRYIA